MSLSAWIVILLAQHVHTHTRPLYVEPVTVSPRPVTESEVTRIPAAPAVVVPSPVVAPVVESWWDAHPWWPFLALLAAWGGWKLYRRESDERLSLPGRRTEPDEEAEPLPEGHYGPPRPTASQWRVMKMLADVGALIPLERRSLQACRTLYIDTIRAQVRAMIGRADIKCIALESAPIEMRWRAWMGSADWQTAEQHQRATGRSEGAALKRLLANHRAYGGDWIGFAVDRKRAELAKPVVTTGPDTTTQASTESPHHSPPAS